MPFFTDFRISFAFRFRDVVNSYTYLQSGCQAFGLYFGQTMFETEYQLPDFMF